MKTWEEFVELFRDKTKGGYYNALIVVRDGSSYFARSYQALGTKIYLFDEEMQIIGDVKLSDVKSVE
jgi:hypothetical protein